jgi:YD repeat-containing protein
VSGSERIQISGGELAASATFYVNARSRKVIATRGSVGTGYTYDAAGNTVAITYYTPPKARYAEASAMCEPIPPPHRSILYRPGTGSDFVVNCPSERPYLVSVSEVVADGDGDFTTNYDQYQPLFTATEQASVLPPFASCSIGASR